MADCTSFSDATTIAAPWVLMAASQEEEEEEVEEEELVGVA